jgi:hypothetical protein
MGTVQRDQRSALGDRVYGIVEAKVAEEAVQRMLEKAERRRRTEVGSMTCTETSGRPCRATNL